MTVRQRVMLWAVAIINGLIAAVFVWAKKDLVWHAARNDELNATFQAFRDTGVLLIKRAGAGSYGAQAPSAGDYALAGWDDDPGSYLLASLIGAVTHAESPYPGLRLALAALVFLAGLWLPFLLVSVFKTLSAGYLALSVPLLFVVINGTPLMGSEYAKSDETSSLPVYALYSIPGAILCLGLMALIWASVRELTTRQLIVFSVGIVALSGIINLFRSNAGLPLVFGLALLWALRFVRLKRLLVALAVAVFAYLGAAGVQKGVMYPINAARADYTGQSTSALPDAHNTWHALYLGLAWPQPFSTTVSDTGIKWADEFGWVKAKEIDPNVVIASAEYDQILKTLYINEVTSRPLTVGQIYLEKLLFTLQYFAVEFLVLLLSLLTIWRTAKPTVRARVRISAFLLSPSIIWGLVPVVLVMPMLYYFGEFATGLGLLTSICFVGALAMLGRTQSDY